MSYSFNDFNLRIWIASDILILTGLSFMLSCLVTTQIVNYQSLHNCTDHPSASRSNPQENKFAIGLSSLHATAVTIRLCL